MWLSSFNLTFYYSKCSEYKNEVKSIQLELDELRNSMKKRENEWRLEKSALEVYKVLLLIINL